MPPIICGSEIALRAAHLGRSSAARNENKATSVDLLQDALTDTRYTTYRCSRRLTLVVVKSVRKEKHLRFNFLAFLSLKWSLIAEVTELSTSILH